MKVWQKQERLSVVMVDDMFNSEAHITIYSTENAIQNLLKSSGEVTTQLGSVLFLKLSCGSCVDYFHSQKCPG